MRFSALILAAVLVACGDTDGSDGPDLVNLGPAPVFCCEISRSADDFTTCNLMDGDILQSQSDGTLYCESPGFDDPVPCDLTSWCYEFPTMLPNPNEGSDEGSGF